MKSPFLNSVRNAIRAKRYSIETEHIYLYWIYWFFRFNGMVHPRNCGEKDIRRFLDYFAIERNGASPPQKVALNSVVFIYRHVPGVKYHKVKAPRKLPVVLTRDEVSRLLGNLNSTPFLCAALMYGSGLSVMESVRLRVSDVDIERLTLRLREGKGGRSRLMILAGEHIELHL